MKVDPDALKARRRDQARALPDALAAVAGAARVGGLDHPIVPRLVTVLSARARACERALERS